VELKYKVKDDVREVVGIKKMVIKSKGIAHFS
jgi:hypothetical protein